MPYATPADLLGYAGDVEALAQVAAPTDMEVVDGDLLRLTVEAGDRSAYTQAQLEAADRALTRIQDALDTAEGTVNGYLARYNPPLASPPRPVVVYTCYIALYHLYGARAGEQEARLYKDAVKFLAEVSRGVISLGADSDTEAPAPAAGAQMESGGRIFGRDDNGYI